MQKTSKTNVTHVPVCHSARPTDDTFITAPTGIIMDSPEQMQRWAQRIKARAVIYQDMPFLNKTVMTAGERLSVSRWILAGAPLR